MSTTAAPAGAPAPSDPAYEASKRAFDALAESDRKAVQDALVWAGLYNGAVDGNFGKGTREALVAFENREGLKADAVVDKGELARLLAAAKKAKEAVRFTVVMDTATGSRIGLPLNTLVKRTATRNGTRFASADDAIIVETRAIATTETNLAKLYERLKADGVHRKVTYKASKANWFVVSGDTGEKRFYTRFATDGSELRGYTLTYPADAAPEFGRVAIAISNSFEGFPAAEAKAGKPAPAAPAQPAAQSAAPSELPPKPRLTATGLNVAPGMIVTVLPSACEAPAVGKQTLKIMAADAASGISLLGFASARAGQPITADVPLAPGAPLVIIGYAAGKNAPTLDVAAGEAVLTAAGETDPTALRVLAPLQEDAQGSAVFDRSGALVGLVARPARSPRIVAGIVPQASHSIIAAADLVRFLGEHGVSAAAAAQTGSSRTAGEIVAAKKDFLVPIECVR